MIKIPYHIQKLKPYKSGKPIDELAREKGLKKIVKLASNENPLGPSPKALEAIKTHLNELHRYPDPSAFELVNSISQKYKKHPDQIITGSGSDSILQNIIIAFSEKDDEILTSQGTFVGWYVNANKYGRKTILVPMKNYHYDLDEIINHISEKTSIIYLANPNNPTGTMFTKNEFDLFVQKVPENILIVLDDACTIYVENNPNYPNGFDYNLPNLIVVRSLSKAYGLAGLRIGFAIGPPDLIRELYKVKLPFEPNALAQAAAIAALDDDNFLKRTVELNKISLKKLSDKFDEFGIEYIPTFTNFFLMIFPTEEFAFNFAEESLNKGLILRHVKPFGIPNGVRINSGTLDEIEFALTIIEDIFSKLKHKIKTQ